MDSTYQFFLVLNGIVGPLLLGAAVATFFNGSNFVVSKGNLTDEMMPVISSRGDVWLGKKHFLQDLYPRYLVCRCGYGTDGTGLAVGRRL